MGFSLKNRDYYKIFNFQKNVDFDNFLIVHYQNLIYCEIFYYLGILFWLGWIRIRKIFNGSESRTYLGYGPGFRKKSRIRWI